MPTVKLQSSDGQIFKFDFDMITRCSGTIRRFLEVSILEDDEDAALPLQNISSDTLRMVQDWAKFHFRSDSTENDIHQWQQNFISRNQGELFGLIKAANYLDIQTLHDVTCKTVADMLRHKQPDEMRKILHIKDDNENYSEESTAGFQYSNI